MWRRKASRDRRRSRRKPTHWVGHYGLDDGYATAMAPCTVEDVSRQGARIVIYGGMALDVGQRIVIEVERIGPTPVSFRVKGVARHVSEPDGAGGRTIGVYLALDGRHERHIAESLFA